METTYPEGFPMDGGEGIAILGGCIGLVIWLTIVIFFVAVHCKIFSKAGYHWALGLLMMVPIANFIMLLVLAFGTWPIHKELELLRRNQAGGMNPQPNPPVTGDFRNV